MAGAFTQEGVSGSLYSFWADQFPLSVSTVYPGTRIDTAEIDEWIELWVDAWSRRPQRASSRQLIELSLTAHCFVKQGTDKSRVHALADAARATLSQATVAVRDYETSGTPVVGYAKLFETETRDLTRNNFASLQHSMQHLMVACRGIAQEL
jgi:hypothetical protein